MLISVLKSWPRLDIRLGRLVFGNLTSFTYNHQGRNNLKHLRKNNPQLTSSLKDFTKHIAKNGYYKWPYLISSDIMDKMIASYQSALQDPSRSFDVMSTKAKQDNLDVYCRSVLVEQLPEINELVTPEIYSLIHAFFGGAPKIQISCARRNQHVPPAIAKAYDIYSNSWHCDNEPADRIKMFVALSDITSDCGPLHLLPRPRTREILRQGFQHRDMYGVDINLIEDPQHLIKFEGPVGSVMFVNVTQCLHRAGVPAPGHYRDIAELQFRGS